ncbi:hypothetical protein NQZ68_002711 [Dissostichus eleginoides]|nr:hypothetical protein NQZ68_002711 [Dissostichus eleginoides]
MYFLTGLLLIFYTVHGFLDTEDFCAACRWAVYTLRAILSLSPSHNESRPVLTERSHATREKATIFHLRSIHTGEQNGRVERGNY